MRIALALALAALAGATLAAGCGEKEDDLSPKQPQPLSLLLDFFPNADHAGIYAAQAGGNFEDVGLDVKIRQPADTNQPIKQVAAGKVDIAITYEPTLLLARDENQPVVAVGALVQKPLTSIISLPRADIRDPEDLEGKTVGTAGIDYQTAFLRTILRTAGVPSDSVETRNVGFDLNPPLLTRKVDATLGGYWNYEGTQLRLARRHPRIIRVNDAGVPTYNELVFVVNEKTLADQPGKVRAFLGAVARGTRALQADPNKGSEGLLAANKDLDPKLQRASVRTTLPLFFPPAGKPYGYQDPAEWQRFATWMRDNELVSEPPQADEAFSNRLLPGAAP